MSAREDQDAAGAADAARDGDVEGIVNAFLRRFLEDELAGDVRSLDDYQRAFPGYETLIAREYNRLLDRSEGSSDEPTTCEGAWPDDLSATTAGGGGAVAPPPGPLPREKIGPYKLLSTLGEGGMGTVYLAEQTQPIRRRVALKRIRLGMDSREVIARFETERQALAILSHPNIARVFDAGATDDGRPYFVMEYVKGEPITSFCDSHKLSTRDRLNLFLEVCEGVQHAHQKGIIHRDLKPSNILVTLEEGRPIAKIIDFGIAKSLHQPLTEKTAVTQIGQLIGTPAYTSPEQAEVGALDIDTRTDIYSLGVLLYELMVGALPLDPAVLRQAGYAELQRRILEDEPLKPSTRFSRLGDDSLRLAILRGTDRSDLLRELKGDLDWIVMKSIEKERTRRYASASELAADIRRHLAHEPVLARPPSVSYRLAKFARRRRVSLSFTAAILLAIVGFAFLQRHLNERRLATMSRERLEEARSLLLGYRDGRRELLEARGSWEQERSRLPTWAPVWEREKELELWERLEHQERQVSRTYSESLIAFYDSFQHARPGSPEERDVQRELEQSLWPIHTEGQLRREAMLGTDFLRTLFLSGDRSAALAQVLAEQSEGRVVVESDPAGASVYVFRYEMVEGRLFPLPFDAAARRTVGEPLLEVEWVSKDRDPPPPFRPGDRLQEIDGKPVHLLRDVVDALGRAGEGDVVTVLAKRGDDNETLSWTPFPRERPERIRRLRDDLGVAFSGYPVDLLPEAHAGTTPLELTLPNGSYLLVLDLPGHRRTRYPVSIPLPAEQDARSRVRLPRPNDVPPGFVHVPGGRFTCGGDEEVDQPLELGHPLVEDFFISRLEVTVREYREYLNARDEEIDAGGRLRPSSPWVIARLRRSASPRAERIRVIPVDFNIDEEGRRPPFFRRDREGHWRSATGDDWPVMAVTLLAAVEYAHWRSEQDPEWQYRLPSDLEWEKTARGVDARFYVWGNYPVWSFARSVKGREGAGRQGPAGVFSMDESVYGARDLAGSVSEMTTQLIDRDYDAYAVRGGNWWAITDYFLRAANRNGVTPAREAGVDTGFRLVAEPKR